MTTITVTIKTWFQKSFGNTYYSAKVRQGDDILLSIPFKYGCEARAVQEVIEALKTAGHLPKVGPVADVWQMEIQGALFVRHNEVSRKKDL